MATNREIEIATITITVMRRKKRSLLPGWEYGTKPTDALRPKDEPVVIEMFEKVRKAL